MKYLILISFIALSCRTAYHETFYYQDNDIYHVSQRHDTTLLNYSDIRVLKIDLLTDKYLELNAER